MALWEFLKVPLFYLPAIASYAKHVSCMPYVALAGGKGDLVREYATADEKVKIRAKEFAVLDVAIADVNLYYYFVVVEELSEELVIGSDMMQRWKIKLDIEKE